MLATRNVVISVEDQRRSCSVCNTKQDGMIKIGYLLRTVDQDTLSDTNPAVKPRINVARTTTSR
jgi:hypothetical protein